MVQVILGTSCPGGLLMGIVLWLIPVVAVQAGDDYLSILEAEAADTGTSNYSVADSDNTNTRNKMLRNVRAGEFIEPGLDFETFEEILGTRYSGSNSLYVKLSVEKRKRIFIFYQKDNRISSVREEIVHLLSSG